MADEKLEKIVAQTYRQGGKVIIPAFSVGRTQELVYSLHRLTEARKLPSIPIFVDSPLSVNVTEIFRLHPECFDQELNEFISSGNNRDPFGFHRLTYIRSTERSKELNFLREPAVIISASGMCEAGRVLHHLKNNIEDPRNTILIVGYMARNTLGRKILEKQPIAAGIKYNLGLTDEHPQMLRFSFVEKADELPAALEKAARYGSEHIIERYIPGREITAAILDGVALPLVEIIPQGGFYDYTRKYTKGASRYEAPAKLDRSTAERIKREALLAWKALGCRDYARVDFRLSDDGEPSCLEVNTLPGMTQLSLVPMAAAEAGLPFDELIERICTMALERAG
jgi:hypothetical protein